MLCKCYSLLGLAFFGLLAVAFTNLHSLNDLNWYPTSPFHTSKSVVIPWKSSNHFLWVGFRTTIVINHPKGTAIDFQGYAAVGAKIWRAPAWYSSIQPGLWRSGTMRTPALSFWSFVMKPWKKQFWWILLHLLFLRDLHCLYLLAGDYDAPMIAPRTKIGKIPFQAAPFMAPTGWPLQHTLPFYWIVQSFFKKPNMHSM